MHAGSLAGRLSGWLALAVVIAAPWMFATGEAWIWLMLCGAVNIALILTLINWYCRPDSMRYTSVWSYAWLAVVAFLMFQCASLPAGMASRLTALAGDAVNVRREIFNETGIDDILAEKGLGDSAGSSISLAPAATRRALYLFIAYAGMLVIIASHRTGSSRAKRTAVMISCSAFLLALFSIAQHFSGVRLVYGYYDPGFTGSIFGTFTNRNHYASFMNMAFGVALALVLSGTTWRDLRKLETGRQRVSWLLQNDGGLLITKSFVALVIGVSACLALSRGAMISLAVSLVIVYVLTRIHLRGSHVSGHFVAIFIILFVSMVMWMGWSGILRRMGSLLHVISDPLGNARLLALGDTFRLFSASPVLGCGVGSFRHVFPLFTGPDIGFGRWPHAHNDVAELLAEGGIVLALLALWLTVRLALQIRNGFCDADQDNRLFVAGLLVGILAMLLHSFLDFSLHRPANALMFAALIGLAVSGSRSDHEAQKIKTTHLSAAARKTRRILAVMGALFLAGLTLAQMQDLGCELAAARHRQWGQAALRSKTPEQRSDCISEAVREAWTALESGRMDSEQALKMAIRSMKWLQDTRLDPGVRIALADQALLLTASAVQAAPTDYEYWLWLARAAFIGNRRPAASLCLDRARQLAPIQQPVYLYLPSEIR